MNSFDPNLAYKLAAGAYWISPKDAQELQKRCSENDGDWQARCKLLGFYSTHQLCCPQNRNRRVENMIWMIDNIPELPRGIRLYLRAAPGDRPHVPHIRAAWQRRIDAAPNNPAPYQHMGDFLQAIIPAEACSYYEKALSLNGDPAIDSSLVTAKLLHLHGADSTSEDYGQEYMPCAFDVLQAGDQLLEETRNRMQPSEADWKEFFDIAHQLIWNPMLLVFAQYTREAPFDATVSEVCKIALKQMYDTFDAESEVGTALRRPQLAALWNDLVSL